MKEEKKNSKKDLLNRAKEKREYSRQENTKENCELKKSATSAIMFEKIWNEGGGL